VAVSVTGALFTVGLALVVSVVVEGGLIFGIGILMV
jgi:hypothetical protein